VKLKSRCRLEEFLPRLFFYFARSVSMRVSVVLPVSLVAGVLLGLSANSFGQEIVPITATLPIKAVGDSCAELNLGTTANPNLVAAEGVAITADRSVLLTCQSGVWAKQISSRGLYSCESGTAVNWWTVCVERATGQIFSSYSAVNKGTRVMTGWPSDWASGLVDFDCNLDTSTGTLNTSCQETSGTRVCRAASAATAWSCYNW
jgi:hypothetical protein